MDGSVLRDSWRFVRLESAPGKKSEFSGKIETNEVEGPLAVQRNSEPNITTLNKLEISDSHSSLWSCS